MFGTHFYNEGMRRLTIAFGQIFNNIVVQTKDANNSVVKRFTVPLAYAPKEKFLVRLTQQGDLTDKQFATVLPRMGFEISGIKYDPSRKLNKLQKTRMPKTDGTADDQKNKMVFNYTPVPYDIDYKLFIFTATAENGLQIVEQIVPYFQPDYTVTINMVPSMGIKRDVPIIIGNVDYEDSYDGNFETRRAVIYTISFTAKTYLYGPATTAGIVRKVQSDLGTNFDTKAREERIVITPNPSTANSGDDFGFTTTISFFEDGKKFNPTTGSDS
jgi:hypothetical protein